MRRRCVPSSKGFSRTIRRCSGVDVDSDRLDAGPNDARRMAHEIGALLAHAENYRCLECGFSGRNFYWHCPACHAWDSFEPYAIVNWVKFRYHFRHVQQVSHVQ